MASLYDVRQYVYQTFADRAAVNVSDVAIRFNISEKEALHSLRLLHDEHLIVLDNDRRNIIMAHPWAAKNLGFVVASSQQKWWGGCAWDSFAIPSLINEKCLVATHCPSCGHTIAMDVDPDRPPQNANDVVAHFLVPVRDMWNDVVYSCSNQLLFCNRMHVEEWLQRTGNTFGTVLDLPTLWTLATQWYAGRLTPEYRRRTADEAAAFFESIGLRGDFWCTKNI
ncbi:uncharacterized protein LOC119070331 [Bradysia coprophila]|uniref:uncharacterized protein LOC119070331 n=1 Tax=Bradysia coprophila TaxID=38358 RepID=UPI00187DB864|nr:uncharacterized protein LOC119070331 [Bradysia coprophila]